MCDIVMRTPEAKQGLIDLVHWLDGWLKDKIMVEVGSFKGDSTVIFAKYGKPREIYAVDPFLSGIGDITDQCDMRDVKKDFLKNTKRYDNIYHIEKMSADASKDFDDESIDFIYIDALHTYEACKSDLLLWLPKLKKGGVIAGHDYRRRFKGVIRAVNEELGKPEKVFPDSSWIVRFAG